MSPGGDVTLVAELATLETVGADGVIVRGPGPNGVAVDAKGTIHVTNTSLGEIWRIDVLPDGVVGKPALWVKSPLLQRIDGIAFDTKGTAWLASQRNAIITVSRDGEIREVSANDSDGPLQTPTGIAFVGAKAYVNNYDTVLAPNGDGKASERGIGPSIVVIEP